MVDFPIDPAKTALVIVDLQNCFVENSPIAAPEGPQVVERLNGLADLCRRAGIKVIFTVHVVRPDGSNTGVMGDIIPAVRQGIINKGSFSAELHSAVRVEPGDIILEKPRFGSFEGTDLEMILRSNGIDTIIIGGIATNVCCDTTAREANARDFKVLFLSDGTRTFGLPDYGFGPVSAEEIQRVICSTVASVFGQVITTDQAAEKIRSAMRAEVA